VIVDTHAHFIPPDLAKEAARQPVWGVTVEQRDGAPWVRHDQGFAYPLDDRFLGGDAMLADQAVRGIDRSILSLAPTLFLYWIDALEAEAFARYANDSLAEAVAASGGRLAGLASLPMPSPEVAAEELRRSVQELGLRGAHIGTAVESEPLDSERFSPVLEAAASLGVPLLLHPYYVSSKPGLEDFYLTNLFANPQETALAAARLIFSGTLERWPGLHPVLVHAGGFLPYQIGRLDHGWTVRPEPRVALDRRPSEYLERFHFDTITHGDEALRWLIELVGSERVVIGTDLPFDMADADPVARLDRVAPSDRARDDIAGRNAVRLFGLEGAGLAPAGLAEEEQA
jgi:aminocarboxymuconate-semialdehyde decarboxylase